MPPHNLTRIWSLCLREFYCQFAVSSLSERDGFIHFELTQGCGNGRRREEIVLKRACCLAISQLFILLLAEVTSRQI